MHVCMYLYFFDRRLINCFTIISQIICHSTDFLRKLSDGVVLLFYDFPLDRSFQGSSAISTDRSVSVTAMLGSVVLASSPMSIFSRRCRNSFSKLVRCAMEPFFVLVMASSPFSISGLSSRALCSA